MTQQLFDNLTAALKGILGMKPGPAWAARFDELCQQEGTTATAYFREAERQLDQYQASMPPLGIFVGPRGGGAC